MGKYQEVLDRARTTIKWNKNLLSIALNKLSIGKALMLQAVDNHSSDFTEAEAYLNQAVDGLREAGTQHNLPRGLFARATLSRHQNNFLNSGSTLMKPGKLQNTGR